MTEPKPSPQPSSWLVDNADLLPSQGRALDLACGRGRHALYLAEFGLDVEAVDINRETLSGLAKIAAERRLSVTTQEMDLETGEVSLGNEVYDVIVGVHYLHRPLFPAIIAALRPRGLLLYETFTTAQAARGHPKNPAFLLQPGELVELVSPLTVLRQREGEFEDRMVASVVARKE